MLEPLLINLMCTSCVSFFSFYKLNMFSGSALSCGVGTLQIAIIIVIVTLYSFRHLTICPFAY